MQQGGAPEILEGKEKDSKKSDSVISGNLDGESRFALAMGLAMVFRTLMLLPEWREAINKVFEEALGEYNQIGNVPK